MPGEEAAVLAADDADALVDEDGDPGAATDLESERGASLERKIPAALAGLRADLALGRLFPEYSRARLQTWMREGHVTVDGQPLAVRAKVWGGERVTVLAPAATAEAALLPEAMSLEVVFEDDELIVLHKPAGLVVHPGNGNPCGTLQNGLLHHDPELAGVPRAGIVHRLDKDTSGLMVVARTLSAHTDLVRQLQARSVRRHYAALVAGEVPGPGRVDAPVGRHPTQRTRMAVVADGRPAVTHYSVTRQLPGITLLECRLETGRTHQIRVHVQHLGHPMIGDPVYGPAAHLVRRLPPAARCFPRQALHAFRLGLIHPSSGQAMEWQIPLANDLQALLAALLPDG
jgi:23S rRNA pseudouridine1911/1915/1917 synthase